MLFSMLATAHGAFAHSAILSTMPADGALLDSRPELISVTFNEPVTAISARLFDSSGTELPVTMRLTYGAKIALSPPDSLPPGDYLVSYRVTSADGHPIAGAFQFRLSGATNLSNLSSLRSMVTSDHWRWPVVLLKYFHYLALVFAAGAVFFIVLLRPNLAHLPVTLKWARLATYGAIASGIFLLGFQGAQLAGLGFESLLSAAPWSAALESSNAISRGMAMLGLALVAAFLPTIGREGLGRHAAFAGAIAAAVSFAGSGHVVSAEPRSLMTLLLACHTAAAVFWAGSIFPLAEYSRKASGADAQGVAVHFSSVAVGAVGLVFTAGLVMTWVQMDGLSDPSQAISTAYAQRLFIKLLLVAALLGVAAYNKFVLTPRLQETEARRRLGQLLIADLGLVAGILFATSTLSLDAPPRNLLMQERMAKGIGHGTHTGAGHSAAVEFDMEAQSLKLSVSLVPNASGTHDAKLELFNAAGKSIMPVEGMFQLSNAEKGVAALQWRAAPAADGTLRFTDMKLPFPGVWDVEVRVLVDAFQRVVFSKRQKIDPAGLDDMSIDSAGVVINWNTKNVPKDCPGISGDVAITVKVGATYAKPGFAFGFDQPEWRVPPCSRVTVTLVNSDQVRHQFMIHGLPRYIYSGGMFHLEASGGSSRSGTFIVPSGDQTLIAHCDMPQHTEKGLKGQLKIGRGNGDLPSIPGLTAPRRAGPTGSSTSFETVLALLFAVALGIALGLRLSIKI